MTSKNKNKLFWYCQVAGWLTVAVINFLLFGYYSGYNFGQTISIPVMSFSGILVTTLYREFIIAFGWKKLIPEKLILRLLIASVIVSIIFSLLTICLAYLTTTALKIYVHFTLFAQVEIFITNTATIIGWSALYFAYYYFTQFRQTEIEKLKKEIEAKDATLHALKMQVSPHFLFNSMNSLQALIDDHPETAKAMCSSFHRYTVTCCKAMNGR
jgi:hypothetical protein